MPISLQRLKIIGSFRFFGKKRFSKQSCKQSYHTLLGLGHLFPGILYLRSFFSLGYSHPTIYCCRGIEQTSLVRLGYHGAFF